MVEINYKIIIVGLICLTAMFLALVIFDNPSETIKTAIIGIIALAIGVVVPSPPVNTKGNLVLC